MSNQDSAICNVLWKVNREFLRLLEFSQIGRCRTDFEFWEEFADEFIKRAARSSDRYTIWQLSRILPDLEPGSTVIDLGCGFGRLTLLLAEHVARIYAVDQCFKLLRALCERAGNLYSKVEIIDSRWDFIESIMSRARPDIAVLSHSLGVDDLMRALRLLQRCVRKAVHIFIDLFPLMFRECYLALLRIARCSMSELPLSPAGIIFLAITKLGETPSVETTLRVMTVPREKLEEFLYNWYGHLLPLSNAEFRKRLIEEILQVSRTKGDNIELTRVIAHICWRKERC